MGTVDYSQVIFSRMMEREAKSHALYHFAAHGVQEKEARELLKRLAQRCESYLERLDRGRSVGALPKKECKLPDHSFYRTIEAPHLGSRVPEILMFAISKEQQDYLYCRSAAQEAQDPTQKKLWLLLSEEERHQRLEIEAYYEKEVVGKL